MMEKKNTTENKTVSRRFNIFGAEVENKRYNLMGSEVVDGFACKPKKLDPNKPIMHFKTHVFVCDDERCGGAHKSEHFADDLRSTLKEINLHKGANRIKISRTNCFGACRFRGVANICENTRANGFEHNITDEYNCTCKLQRPKRSKYNTSRRSKILGLYRNGRRGNG